MSFKSTILIVDDEKLGREVLGDLLVTQDYHLIFAKNGPEALEQAIKFTPDLILLDIMMPGMDGFEVCKRLRANPTLAEVPIVMITALYGQDSLLKGIKAGADDFISKPFNRVELRARIKTITRLNRYRRLITERNKFEWVVNTANEGYLILDQNDQILYINTQASQWLGLPLNIKTLPTDPFLTLVKKQYQCKPEEAWSTWPPTPTTLTNNIPCYLIYPETPKNKPLWLQVDVLQMESGIDEQYMIRLYNVTDLMVSKSLAWNFHSQVSHKLKTPMGAITGFLNLANKKLSDLSPERLESYLSTSLKNALQLQEKMKTVFEYTELPGLVKPTRGRCFISEITPIIDQIKIDLELEAITINYNDIKNPNNVEVNLAPQVIDLIFLELLKNAQKFHPNQTPTVTIDFNNHPDGIQIKVADDGQLVSPEHLEKVWIPYYQAEKSPTGEVPGMGLGLTMIRTWVWRVGGTCNVYNQQNKPGLVVELVLPLAQIDDKYKKYMLSEDSDK